jgi:hypothetical protein
VRRRYAARVLGGIGAPWIRAVGYGVAAAVCAFAGWRDARRAGVDGHGWPTFWFACAAFLAALAVGRAADWGDLVSEVGRRDARSVGWYDDRRDLQVLAVGGVLAVAALAALAAAWRVLRTGRVRYLPLLIVVLGLGAFVGVRLASLHQIDTLLHGRSVDGLQVGAALELLGIGLAVVLALGLVTSPNRVAPAP